MKQATLILFHFLLIATTLAASTPDKINYQGVARDAEGTILADQQLGVQIQLRTSSAGGSIAYTETHTVTTNQYGLFKLQIGTGNVSGGEMNSVEWGDTDVFVELAMDFGGGSNYVTMGTSQLVAVPYALHAKNADNVFSGNYNDLANKPESLGDFANDPGYVTSSDDADADVTNEIQDLALDGTTLKITNNVNATPIDLSVLGANTDEQNLTLIGTELAISGGNTVDLVTLQDGNTDEQELSLTGTELAISGGNKVELSTLQDGTGSDDQMAIEVPINAIEGLSSSDVQAALEEIQTEVTSIDTDDEDADITNEIQDLSLVGSTLTITNNATATEINLAPFSGTNTDEQLLGLSGTDLSISNGNTIDLSGIQDGVDDADADATNEIQDLNLTGNSLSLTGDASAVDLSRYADNTDEQELSLSGTDLSISGGNTIDLSTIQDGVDDADADATNEIQDLSLTGSTLSITNNASATEIDLSPFAVANTDEQDLKLTGNTLSLTNDASPVDLSGYADNTDEQELSLSGTDLTISGGNTIDLSAIQDGVDDADTDATNEIQDLSLTGSTLTITNNASATEIDLSPFAGTNTDEQDLSLSGNTLSLTNDASTVDLASYLDNTDDQTVDAFFLSGTTLALSLENDGEANSTVDLSGLKDGIGTDNQTIDLFTLTGSNLFLSLENDGEADQSVDLSSLLGAFSTTGGVTSNGSGVVLTDDFVFGSPQLADNGNTGHDKRMFFDKSKGAFRAGSTPSDTWDDANVGINSIGLGSGTTASGQGALATGSNTSATGVYSTAIGNSTNADGYASFSSGAITIASADYSTAMGYDSEATANYATAIGFNPIASGNTSFAIGTQTLASGGGSFAGGYQSTASATNSLAIGYQTTASADYTTAIGYLTEANTIYATAFGRETVASGETSFASGRNTTASGSYATAIGQSTTASGGESLSTGLLSTASGRYSSALGYGTTAQAYATTAIGRFNAFSGNMTSWVATDQLFIVGNGTSDAARSNALVLLKNGNLGLGVNDPDATLEINGQIKVTGGTPGAGKVLTSDADGLAIWSNAEGSDNQTVDILNLNGTNLEISLEDDGEATQTVDLASLSGATEVDELTDAQHDDFDLFVGFGAGGTLSDGGNFNTGIGRSALTSLTSGTHNTALGSSAMFSNTAGTYNIAMGGSALASMVDTDYNVAIGNSALQYSTGSSNVAVGYTASQTNVSGTNNVSLGRGADSKNTGGSQNTIIGAYAGTNTSNSKSGSVFIGYQAGYSETTSNKLYIENSNSVTPLIYGEFDNDIVQVNGALNVTDVLNLKPRATAPAGPSEGDIYFDSTTKKLRVYDGTQWQNCF